MKTMAIISFVIVLMVTAVGCAPDTSSSAPPTHPTSGQTSAATTVPVTTTANEAPIIVPAPIDPPGITPGPLPPTGRESIYSMQIDLAPSKLVYLPGEQIRMELALTNTSRGKVEPVMVQPIPPSVSLIEAGSLTRRALAVPPGVAPPNPDYDKPVIVKTFPAGIENKTLAAGEKVTHQLTWDQKNENGNLVSPGWYYYESYSKFRSESSKELNKDFKASIRERAFLIQYPQGAMTRTIELNQSRTITGLPFTPNDETKPVDVVVTLERVELNEMGATFYVTMTSPNNPASGYNNPEWMGHVIQFSASYVVDGVVKEARAPNSRFLNNGIELRWGASADNSNYIDPLPSDAKELTFTISNVRPDWEGSWEYKIPLE